MGAVCLRSTSGWKGVGKNKRLAEKMQVWHSSGKGRPVESHAWMGTGWVPSGLMLQLLGNGCLFLAVLIQGSPGKDLAHVLVA